MVFLVVASYHESMSRGQKEIDVFEYRNYRAFLRDFYQREKANKTLSLRSFSQRAGLRSPNYLKLVMDGDRNLSPQVASRFAKACNLHADAVDYFCDLVAFNQARSALERARYYDRLRKYNRYRKVYRLDDAHARYHSRWYIPAIRELVVRKDFQQDPKWIARTMMPNISPKEAVEAIKILSELGLLVRDKKGRLRQNEPSVSTAEGPLGYHIVTYHHAMLERAADALERVPREDRDIASVTLCLSQKKMQQLKAHLERFRFEIIEMYEPDENPERVVQVNFQMFPLTVKKED
ncbi:MAG: TIGR02147 family protein [Deltaproteobacteria bacterium]|nr:TIGR02147 family protein [Deltaproteobacteria bacterium]